MRERIEARTSKGTIVDLFGVDVEDAEVIALGVHSETALRKGARVVLDGRSYRLTVGVRAGLRVCGGPDGLNLEVPVVLEKVE